MAADIGIDDPFYNDRPMFFVGYYKNGIIALYTISTVSGGMMACNTMEMYSIPKGLYTAGQLGMVDNVGTDEPFYNDRPIIFVVYNKCWSIALYYTIAGSLYTAGQ